MKNERFVYNDIEIDIYQNAIFFIWLSYKLDREWNILEAFSAKTASWKILQDIKDKSWKNIVMLNLVQWVPLDKNWKIRYPSNVEKKKWYEYIKWLIEKYNPEKIFLFWKQVQDMFKEDKNKFNGLLWFVDHPSYISVYKKSEEGDYKQYILDSLNN